MKKIISWNVNGLRSLSKNNTFEDLLRFDADVFCLQETKAEADQLSEEIRNPDGYHGYFWSSQERKGYSGVAIYSREKPVEVIYGFPSHPDVDTQGRLIAADYGDWILLNCYFPNGGRDQERLPYKLHFYDLFLEYIEELQAGGKRVVWCGDVNVAHEPIDIARAKENEGNTGFLPEERAWVDEAIGHGWVDVFRDRYPERADSYTYWDTITRARDRNVGWRIDYFFVHESNLHAVQSIKHHTEFLGSDHCPIEISIDL
jgi:exodeoxyribonuclease-3